MKRNEYDELLDVVPHTLTQTFERKHLGGETLKGLNEGLKRIHGRNRRLILAITLVFVLTIVYTVVYMVTDILSHVPPARINELFAFGPIAVVLCALFFFLTAIEEGRCTWCSSQRIEMINRQFHEFRTALTKLIPSGELVLETAARDLSLETIGYQAFTLAREVLVAEDACSKIRLGLHHPLAAVETAIGSVHRQQDRFNSLWDGVTEFELPISKEGVFQGAKGMMLD